MYLSVNKVKALKEQGVIMWLVVFLVGCTVPLFIMAGIVFLREKNWERYNKNADKLANA